MPLSRAKIRWGYLIALLLMLLSYGLIFFIIRKLANETNWVTHSYNVIQKMDQIKGDIADAETGVRGYLLTNDYRYLKPYNDGSRNVPQSFEQLKLLTKDNKKYSGRLDSLGRLLQRRLLSLSNAVKSYQMNGFQVTPELLAPRHENKTMMDSIRLLLSELQEEENQVASRRDGNLQGFYDTTSIMTAVSLLIALVTIVYSVLIYNRENRAKLRAIANAKSYSMQLEERVQDLDRANRELEELRSMEKFAATGRIARTIAHEVRNPLTNIALASEQVRELTDDNEESDVLLDMIGRNVNRINQLVSELLNSTRFGQLEYSSVQINDLLDEALELAQDRMELKEIELEKHYAPDLCHVYVDKEKMKIALLNIIVNALEAMEKGKGQLVFRTRVMDDRCQIEISDNGVGMDEETLARLFEPYFTSKKKGNGLGLTNTQNIILNHKGNIQVKSKPGAGTTFIVTLNMNRKPVESEEKSPQNV